MDRRLSTATTRARIAAARAVGELGARYRAPSQTAEKWEAWHGEYEYYAPICCVSFGAIAQRLGVSRGRIEQIQTAALRKIQERLRLDLQLRLSFEDILTWASLIYWYDTRKRCMRALRAMRVARRRYPIRRHKRR